MENITEIQKASSSRESLRYPDSVKRQVAQEVINDRKSITHVSREHKIASPTIARWVREYTSSSNGHTTDAAVDKTELSELRKAISVLDQQVQHQNEYIHKLERLIIQNLFKLNEIK